MTPTREQQREQAAELARRLFEEHYAAHGGHRERWHNAGDTERKRLTDAVLAGARTVAEVFGKR